MNDKSILLILALAAGGFLYANKIPKSLFASAPTQTMGIQHFSKVSCESDLVVKVLDAYPQSKMSQAELSQQTLAQGYERVQQFRSHLPSIVAPVIGAFHGDATAWAEIKETAQQIQKLQVPGQKKFDPVAKKKVEDFVAQVKTDMTQRCPASLGAPDQARFVEFGLGAILGELNKHQ